MIRTPNVDNKTNGANVLSLPAQFLGAGMLFFPILAALTFSLTGGLTTLGALIGMGIYILALMLGLYALRGYPYGSIGLCNAVTLFRLMLVTALVAALITPTAGPWPIFAIAAVALLLDGVDGWLARRGGYVSDFGAMFDMEVDAAFALVLALHAYLAGHAGAFILLLGLPRYIFWIAQVRMPWLRADLPARFSRKLVCVVQISVLIAVLVPAIGRPLSDVLAGTAALALLWSFWLDVRWLWRSRL